MPDPVAGYSLWLKADAGVLDGSGNPATDGVAVATWQDQSGNGHHATQGTSGSRPTFETGIANGLPAVHFGGDDFFDVPSLTYRTLFIVGQNTNAAFADFDGILGGDVGLPNNGHLLNGMNGSTRLARGVSADASCWRSGVAKSFSSGWDFDPIDAWWLASVVYDADHTQAATLGVIAGGVRFWRGYVSEVIAYPTALSTGERQWNEGVLAWKWGLQGSLPADHPYKNAPPAAAAAGKLLIARHAILN